MHISTLVFFLVPWCPIHLDRSLCGCQHSFPVEKAHVRSVRLVGAWGIQLAPELWWKSRDLWTGSGQSLPVTWKRSLRSRWSRPSARAWATGNRAGMSSYYGGQWENYGMESRALRVLRKGLKWATVQAGRTGAGAAIGAVGINELRWRTMT